MKFVCTKENLAYALDTVSPLAGKHAQLPILSHVLINASESKVEFSATNLEVAIKTAVRAKVEEAGTFTVPAKTLADFVHLLQSEQVDLSVSGNELVVTSGNSSTKIKGAAAEDFPVIPEIEEGHGYAVDADALRRGLSRAVSSAAKNEIRPELSGVYIGFMTPRYDGLVVAATDSYRLAEVRIPVAQKGGDADVKSILPARVAYELVRLIQLGRGRDGEKNVRVWLSGGQFAARYDDFEMTSRVIDGTYPDYAQIIPVAFKTTAVFDRDIMINKIKAASIFTTTGVNAVSFDLNSSGNSIGVSSTSTQTGEHASEMDADITGEENSILLNHRYVLEGLAHMEGDKANFLVNSSDSPCMFTPVGEDGFLYIVMPIRQ